jgi:nicotinamidase-related amidase/alkylated DNA repair dioxygenase AlkB
MLSLLDLISQNQPHLQTHRALLIIGLQKDFIDPDGRLPVDLRTRFLERIDDLIPKFRKSSANVIWVKTLYEADRLANDPTSGEGDAVVVGGLVDGVESSSTDDDEDLPKDLVPPTQSRSSRHRQRALDLLKKVSNRRQAAPPKTSQATAEEDEELFLLRTPRKAPACLSSTPGADFVESIIPRIEPSDAVVQTTNYSAFLGTSLLLKLRTKLITELYICGCLTNVSVLATVIDAARHGIKINVVEDCLGYRKQNRHDEALKRMVDFFDANLVTSEEILDCEQSEATESQPQPMQSNHTQREDAALEALLDNLNLGEGGRASSSTSSDKSPIIKINGRQLKLADVSLAETDATDDTKLSDDQFAELLAGGAKITRETQPTPVKQELVKSKPRMRSRSSKPKKEEEKKVKEKVEKVEEKDKGKEKDEPGTIAAPAEPAKVHPLKTVRATERTAIAKAESSDKLRGSPAKREKALKSSVSQPALPNMNLDERARPTDSRGRLALSKPPNSDSSNPLPNRTSPPKPTTAPATVHKASAQPIKPSTPAMSTEANPTTTAPLSAKSATNKLKSLANFPVLRPGDRIAEGDSRIVYDFFPAELRHPTDPSKPLRDLVFTQLYNEVRWQKMLHQQGEVPRLVCCQGEFGGDGSMPVYRHPVDQALPLLHFSPKVQVIRKRAEKLVGHPLNHVLIQLYRSGNDFISEHSDKTLDVVRGSSIVNVSFGAHRTMRLRTKKAPKPDDSDDTAARETQRVAMPHNSMFVLGLESNKKWLHGIQPDKRILAERSEDENAYNGIRISLTFRHIGTFLDAQNRTIWGQGATSQAQHDAQDVINDDEEENEKMVRAFSRENHNPDFDWDEWYGDGFDVLHFRNAPADLPILFASNNHVETNMMKMFLAETKIPHTLLEAPKMEKEFEVDRQVCFRDNDVNHTEVNIMTPVLLYLDRYYALDKDDRGRYYTSLSYDTFILISTLLKAWFNRDVPTFAVQFSFLLESLEERQAMGPGPFIAGRRFSGGDCAAWPALHDVVREWEGWSEERFPCLSEYYAMMMRKRKSVRGLGGSGEVVRGTGEVVDEE